MQVPEVPWFPTKLQDLDNMGKVLTKGLDFEDEESFATKVRTVKESYFKKEVAQTEEIQEDFIILYNFQ